MDVQRGCETRRKKEKGVNMKVLSHTDVFWYRKIPYQTLDHGWKLINADLTV